ncbi:MAG: DNA polymerase/3'-5' exonuclease PolX [Anaerolineae bacterium]|nr:DNA polymerase/3'-5' exonuclease PolX [Anaerolineae bacterium]MDW8173042.1 DNA polymerase/3'-5' exonuclease PolX [Anaerolineae bacterium]
MGLTNKQIATIFLNIADLLEIQGENKFKFLAYRRAGEVIMDLSRDLRAYADDGTLEDIPGVGKAIAEKTRELLETGRLAFYERLIEQVPETLVEVMRINGVGPKKAKLFWEQLQIVDVESLEQAARAGKLRDLTGMGVKSEQKILEGIAALSRQGGRMPIGKARPAAERMLALLMSLPQAQRGAIAGSIRRGKITIGDVDLLIASDEPEPLMNAFVRAPEVERVLGQGPTKSSVELAIGLQMDLRVVPLAQWGTALQYFTGSKDHNVKLRQIALDKGYSLNEFAFSPVDAQGNLLPDAPKVTCATEEEVYAFLGLPYIPPELREDAGEIEAAKQNVLPRLVVLDDLRGDLHMHTTWSDGTRSIRQMAEEAHQRGRQYIVITDHSPYVAVANGLAVERLWQQREEIRQVAAEMGDKIRVLHGAEVDIRADGTLDYPDEVLSQLDFVVASLHVSLSQSRDQIMHRLLNAMRNPHVDLIGHPSGRYVPDREPIDADWDEVLRVARQTGVALEINANPRRLDLDAQYARRAAQMGILLAIDSDAHDPHMMDLLDYGIVNARRGWVEARHVINTWPYEQFWAWVQARGQQGL